MKVWKEETHGYANYLNPKEVHSPLSQRLNEIESQGWTIFSVSPPTHQYAGYFILYFKEN